VIVVLGISAALCQPFSLSSCIWYANATIHTQMKRKMVKASRPPVIGVGKAIRTKHVSWEQLCEAGVVDQVQRDSPLVMQYKLDHYRVSLSKVDELVTRLDAEASTLGFKSHHDKVMKQLATAVSQAGGKAAYDAQQLAAKEVVEKADEDRIKAMHAANRRSHVEDLEDTGVFLVSHLLGRSAKGKIVSRHASLLDANAVAKQLFKQQKRQGDRSSSIEPTCAQHFVPSV
jgi:hypothetical protein